jgi:hypothetical protein
MKEIIMKISFRELLIRALFAALIGALFLALIVFVGIPLQIAAIVFVLNFLADKLCDWSTDLY